MKKQLRKPENWQDFETLCKILWGEIWECAEIKKNGRSGQKQDGVDVYGTPKGETEYYGIQCKGKDDYTNSLLTEEEIVNEINKAKNFKPQLKKFYFATTANKDVKIEEYVRLKDKESRDSNSFEIHLFAWEDIVDLIDENRKTHDWYINKFGYKTKYDVNITFSSGETHLNFSPKLWKNYISYRIRNAVIINSPLSIGRYLPQGDTRKDKLRLQLEPQPQRFYANGQSKNLSSCVFALLIENIGNVSIENYKMYIRFRTKNIIVDTVDKQERFLDLFQYKYNTHLISDSDCIFEPNDNILVQTDKIRTDKICLRPTIEEPQDIDVEYEFVAKDFNKKGKLTISLNTIIKEKESIEYDDYPREDEILFTNYTESF
jgi:hypothetical protein